MDSEETPIITLKQIVAAIEKISIEDQEKLRRSIAHCIRYHGFGLALGVE